MSFFTEPVAEHTIPVPAVALLVVDDQLAVREGLARLFGCAPLVFRAIATAASKVEALRLAALLRPEVVVLDVDLAGEDGLALIEYFTPAACVLVLSCHGDEATRARATRLGALAFIEKHQPAADLLAALMTVATLQARGEKTPPGLGESTLPMQVASSAAPTIFRP